jgi:hypothetical protein
MRNLVLVALMLLLSASAALATNLPTLDNDATVDCTPTGTGTCAVLTNGAGTVSFNLSSSGASGLTYNFQGTSDGTHWFTVSYADPTATPPLAFVNSTLSATSGQWLIAAGGLQKVRLNLTAYSAGTLTIHGEAGSGSTIAYTVGGDILAGAVSSSKLNARQYFNTGNADAQPHVCGSYKLVHNITSATDTQIVAASGSTNIFVCDFEFSVGSAATNFYLEKGTSGTCGGLTQLGITHHGSANMTAKASNALYRGFNTGAGNQLCVNTDAAGPLDIGVFYDQY